MPQETFIRSDIDPLKRVVVQRPANERRRTHIFARGINMSGFADDYIGKAALDQHDAMVTSLQESGVEVLETHQLINEAVVRARESNTLLPFLEKYFPRLRVFEDAGRGSQITADDLIGATNKQITLPNSQHQVSAQYPLQWMYYTRDTAMMTPEGVVLAQFEDNTRKAETALIRFMYQNSPALQQYPIVFDAEKEGVLLQGGDFIQFDEGSILLGVDNMTSRSAASRLAQKLNKLVIAVAMPAGPTTPGWSPENFSALHVLFLHLDTIFNLVDKHKALAIPYFLQNEFDDNSPFFVLLESLAADPLFAASEQDQFRNLQQILSSFGQVTLYEAGTGQAYPTRQKLLDFLQDSYGFSFIFAGGAPKNQTAEQIDHLTEVVMPEVRFQGANVVATRPGEVLIYAEDTEETQKALDEHGITVKPFSGHQLARWNGGPHCMTSPIERAAE